MDVKIPFQQLPGARHTLFYIPLSSRKTALFSIVFALLAGAIVDRGSHTRLFSIEGSRRLGDAWKAVLEIRTFAALSQSDLVYDLRKDHYGQLRLARYF